MAKGKKKINRNQKNASKKTSTSRTVSLTKRKIKSENSRQEAAFPVVGVGASAGGLEAYMDLFRKLPPDTGMAFVLVQHLSPRHLSMLSTIVQKTTKMQVLEITDGTRVKPNSVYVIPPNFVLEIFHSVLHLRPMTVPHSTNRLVDTFFSSLARDHRNLAVGVVLSGTGSDGAQGLRDIKAEGGISLVQDPLTAKYDGMPRMAIAVDHPDHVLSVEGLVSELVKIAANPHVPKIIATEDSLSPENERYMQKIFIAVRTATGTDFSVYKSPTMVRRVKRRMVLNGIESMQHYHSFLQSSKGEAKALFKDLIINVTKFFRDPEVFEVLKARAFPAIISDRPEGSLIRVWVPGCSTGEEVYSLAICLMEFLGDSVSRFPIQIYGTDLSDGVIKKARAGLYTDAIEKEVSPERLSRFFVKEKDGYRISKTVRDSCIFSIQDITTDPPIHRLDLLSCRNLMIYLSATVQKKLMETFFYALNQDGFLLLGASESVGTAASLFSQIDEKSRIYLKRSTAVAPKRPFRESVPAGDRLARLDTGERTNQKSSKSIDVVSMAENIVLEKYAPAWMLVNEAMDIVHFKGKTENLIAPRSGPPSWSLVRLMREDLVSDVRILLHAVQKDDRPVRKNDLKIKVGGAIHLLDIEAISLAPTADDLQYLVLFFERPAPVSTRKSSTATKNPEVAKLKDELASTQKSLRSLLEDQNSTNEELQSANEEVLSANEELQSTNEELETAKEELQSTNEELVTVNEELSVKNAELSLINDDLINILGNAHLAIVIVNSNHEIRRFTPAAGKLMNLAPGDIGRKLTDFSLGFPIEQLHEKLAEVTHNISSLELEAQDRTGHFYSIRMRPYKTTDNRVDGAVLTFIDIDNVKIEEQVAQAIHRYSNAIVQTIHDPLVILNRALRVEKVNKAFRETFKVTEEETLGKPVFELGNGQWNIPALKKLLEEVLPKQSEIRDFRMTHEFTTIGKKTMLINAQRLEWEKQKEILILLAIRDVTSSEDALAKGN